MKKVIAVIAIVAFVVALPVSHTVFAKKGDVTTSEFCKANNDLGLESHGACVSMIKSLPAKVCNDFDNLGQKNHGQCVKFLKALLP